MQNKVFCIGFQKTGTTTMVEALKLLGYRVTGPDHVRDKDIAEKLERVTAELSHRFDAFQDNPWPLVYRQMDALHPGSKFILTVRDPQKWYESYRNHFEGVPSTPMQRTALRAPRSMTRSTTKVACAATTTRSVDYFQDRPDDLLVIDVTRDHRWEPICAFLELPVPAAPFPHSNQRKFGFLPRKPARC